MSNPHLETQESEQEDYIFNPVQQQSKNKVKFDKLVNKVGTAFHPNHSETETETEQVDSQMSQQRISQREMERNQRENIKLERRMKTIQVATPLSVLLNAASVGICTFAFGKKGLEHVNAEHKTYFSPNGALLGLYWAVLYVLMVGFSVLAVISRKRETKQMLTSSIGPNLAIANFMMAIWAPLWLLNQHWTLIAGEVLLGINALVLLWSSVVLGVWYAPVLKHPLDWAFIHVPVKMFFAVTFQLDLWQQLFIVLGWDNKDTIEQSIWPTFGISIGISVLFSLWIFATTDITLTVCSIYLQVAVMRYRKIGISGTPAELIASGILSIALLTIAIFSSLAWSRLQKRREGRIALPIDGDEARRLRAESNGNDYGNGVGGPVGAAETYRDEEGVVVRDATEADVEEGRADDGVRVTRKIGSNN